MKAAPVGTMLGPSAADSFGEGLELLIKAGAEVVTGGKRGGGKGYCFQNTLLRTTGKDFIADPEGMQTEIFGNGGLFVVCDSIDEIAEVCRQFEGNLTGCIYSDTQGSDDALYWEIAPELRSHVGRLLNDKMPTGVSSTSSSSTCLLRSLRSETQPITMCRTRTGGHFSGDEPRRPLPRDRLPAVHRCRNSRLDISLDCPLVLREQPPHSLGGRRFAFNSVKAQHI